VEESGEWVIYNKTIYDFLLKYHPISVQNIGKNRQNMPEIG
jgi:hypothetical protein